MEFFRFFMILSRIKKGVYLYLFEHANTTKHVYEHCCSSVRSILAHLAHLAQFLFIHFLNLKSEKKTEQNELNELNEPDCSETP